MDHMEINLVGNFAWPIGLDLCHLLCTKILSPRAAGRGSIQHLLSNTAFPAPALGKAGIKTMIPLIEIKETKQCVWCGKPTENFQTVGPHQIYYCNTNPVCYAEFRRIKNDLLFGWKYDAEDK